MGYERRRRTRRGQFVPRLLRLESLRRANLSQTKSRHSQVVASREEKPNLRPGPEPVTKASWQVTICRGVRPEQFPPQWNPSPRVERLQQNGTTRWQGT